ncbi:MAG TPA: ABC transporter ATP-binding protein [Thermotogota bacterium]|nr:ABC transporter ATP-binding protein [Thermotogota bacterium]HRW92223.1 ABC transporter ATP-binding protein [Thermotogota bacterium]
MKKNEASVYLENVTKVFSDPHSKKDVVAVDRADITIEPGHLVTLLGPSGCGKTTTLRMIAGFELPTKGKIFIGSEEVTYLPPNKRDTAMVFQSYGLFPHMNVFDNVAYGLKLRKVPKEERRKRVLEILKMVGLEELGSRSPGRLSGGQQQRVSLARSLIVRPSVLLLDEPLSNLDALLREQMRVEIRRIQQSLGITAIYVTHDRVEAMSLSDLIIVMNAGKIIQVGPPSEIYENPVSRFVAGFIGKVALLPVQVQSLNGTARVAFRDQSLEIPRYSSKLEPGSQALMMCRPESMRVEEAGQGLLDGRVLNNIYLGNSVETYVQTDFGEILVQIDNPAQKKVFPEGSGVSIRVEPGLAKILPSE